MSLPISITGASTPNPQRPERRKSRAHRRLPATEAQQHDIVLETAVTVAPDPARDQMPVDGLPTAAVIDQMWQANPLQKLLPVDWEAITQALSMLGAPLMQTDLGCENRAGRVISSSRASGGASKTRMPHILAIATTGHYAPTRRRDSVCNQSSRLSPSLSRP